MIDGGRGLVAAGHPKVRDAAAEILAAGGNAFDAAAAAGFAASAAEPMFTSLGGGGFLLAHTSRGRQTLFDFFTDTPGRGLAPDALAPHFLPVTVRFPASEQVFNIGLGSVAVPGTLSGLLHFHGRLGRVPLRDVVAPAVALARNGLLLNAHQAYVIALLVPIHTLSEAGRAIYSPAGRPLTEGERLVNPDLASTLESLCEDSGRDLYQGLLAVRIADDMRAGGGLVTGADLAAYRVVERTPLTGDYRGNRLLGNPPPARGGALLALALDLLRAALPVPTPWGSAAHVTALASVMCEVERRRGGAGGTTHISVVDAEGNVASMSLSNGEGSGYVVPGTGIMLNNMLGEDDLHPGGFHASPAGVRVESMMAPTVLLDDGLPRLVLGSGGSKRIRTALLQVISNVVDFGMTPERAVRAPRLHFDGERLQAEPGYAPEALAALGRHYDVNVWEAPNLYFGGVHAAVPGQGACGDPRRGGAAASIGQPALGSGGGV